MSASSDASDFNGAADTASDPAVALTVPRAPSGRLAVLTALAAGASAVPIPFLPDALVERIRGTVIYDVTSRHGLSVTSEARKILAASSGSSGARAAVKKMAFTLGRRLLKRAGPLATLGFVLGALEVYALGELLERYITNVRPTGTVRISADEARAVRDAIDRSVVRALQPGVRAEQEELAQAVEDLRDEFTRIIDTALLTSASLPSYLERRLKSSFDDVAREMPSLGRV